MEKEAQTPTETNPQEEAHKPNPHQWTAQDYISYRLRGQMGWYEVKASFNKKRHMYIQSVIIVLGAIIPLLVVTEAAINAYFGKNVMWAGYVSAFLSAIIAILAGFDKLHKPQENWFNYRAVEETLKKEEILYEMKVGPYDRELPEQRIRELVLRTETIIANDISRFSSSEQKDLDKRNENKDPQKPLAEGNDSTATP